MAFSVFHKYWGISPQTCDSVCVTSLLIHKGYISSKDKVKAHLLSADWRQLHIGGNTQLKAATWVRIWGSYLKAHASSFACSTPLTANCTKLALGSLISQNIE